MARAAEFRTIMNESIDAPAGYDKQKLWAACYKQWTIEWQQLTTCRMTKIFFPKPNKNKMKKHLNMAEHICVDSLNALQAIIT